MKPTEGVAAGKTILVVEDEETIGESVAAIIRSEGGTPVRVHDGEAAYGIFLRNRPDLCLIDILLPGLNGLELTRRIKKKAAGKPVPVVLVSAVYREPEDIEYNRRSCGADDYLAKPFTGEALVAVLKRHLGGGDARSRAGLAESGDHGGVRHELNIPLQGSLQNVEFAEILVRLFLSKLTGTLAIQTGSIRREIYVIEGRPVFARANTLAESLGTLLIRKGLADLQQINEILKNRSGNRTMGQQLIEAGIISTEDLMATLSEQVRERIMTCFGIGEGKYSFDEGTDFVDHIQVYRQNPIELIRFGIERNLQVNQLAEKLQNAVDKYVVRTEHFDLLSRYFPLSEVDEQFVAQLDGKKTLTQALQSRILDVTKALQLVWSLRLASLIEFSGMPIPSESRPQVRLPAASSPELRVRPQVPAHRAPKNKPSIEPGELRRLVIDKYLTLGKANSYQLLGIDRSASDAEIDAQADALLELFALETTEVLSAEDRVKANEVYSAILMAQRTLVDPKERISYDESLSRVDSLVGVTSEYRLNRGALAYGAAKRLIEAGKLSAALEHLQTAASHNPEDPNMVADLVWVEYQLNLTAEQAALSLAKLNEVLSKAPQNTRILYYLGVLEAEVGDLDTGLQHLRNVLAKNPNHEEAQKRLAEFAPPSVDDFDETGSAWSKLFGDT
jgi:CheY-like chemotaxis protein